MMVNNNLVGGVPTPLKNMKLSWDGEIPNIWKHKSHAPNHQPAYLDQSIIIIHLNSWAIIQFPFTARCFSNPSKSSLNHQEITIKSHETCSIFPNPIPE